MKDLAILLEDRPGALAEMGEALGRAGVSIEGGGAWLAGGRGVGHFLFADGGVAPAAPPAGGAGPAPPEAGGIRVVREREVLVERLKQAVSGQLGILPRRMGDAGVNIE